MGDLWMSKRYGAPIARVYGRNASAFAMDMQKVQRQSYVESMRELRVSEYLKDVRRKQRTEDAMMNDHDVNNGEVGEATRTAIAEFDALEPTDDGTVISWVYERRKTVSAYHFDTETFEYVAIRAAGRWYPTGSIGHKRFGGFSWRELGAMVQTDALRRGDFHIVTGWAHRDDVTDGE